MNNLPLISIIIPTFRRASYLDRAIESALNQSYTNIEVLIVDDNEPETDYRKETASRMVKYQADSRVKYILHPKNLNGAAARNTGIRNSQGEYICFLDDDDWYLPDKLQKQYDYLISNPQFDAVYCGWKRDGKKTHPYKYGDLSFELLSGIEIIYTNAIMIKRKNTIECGGWDERFQRNQEAVFLIRFFSCGGRIGVISDYLVEFDISDIQNRSKPPQFEKDFEQYLSLHQFEIDSCKLRYPDAREIIYSYRYRGVLINYIKYGDIISAISVYRKMSKLLPHRFLSDCCLYIRRKITGKKLFKEFEKETEST